jgi:hypothetical protein
MKLNIPDSSRAIPQALMQALGTHPVKKQVETFFKHIGYDPNMFSESDALATFYTFRHYIETEDVGEPPVKIKYNGITYFKPDDLLDMPLKFLVELVNIDIDIETKDFFYAVTALLYRKDWSRSFNKKEYLDGQKIFFDAPYIYSLYSLKLFNQLIVSLQNSYPVLYKGEQKEQNDGRKMYSLIRTLANEDATKMAQAEDLEIWRAFSWMEDVRIDEINKKNEQ